MLFKDLAFGNLEFIYGQKKLYLMNLGLALIKSSKLE